MELVPPGPNEMKESEGFDPVNPKYPDEEQRESLHVIVLPQPGAFFSLFFFFLNRIIKWFTATMQIKSWC